MSPALKVAAVALGVGAAALGITEFVSQGPEAAQSKQLELMEMGRQAELVGMSEEDAGITVPANLDRETFQRVVADPVRKAMKGGSCDQRSAALAGYMAAARQLTIMDLKIEDYFGPDDNDLVNTFVPAMRKQCLTEAYQECAEKHDFSRLMLLAQHWAREEQVLEKAEADQAPAELLDKCLTFELEFESETMLQVPEFRAEIRAKSLVTLSRGEVNVENSSYAFSGKAPLTVTAQARLQSCSWGEPSPKEPFQAQRLTLFQDTTGWGAMRAEARRIAEAHRALQAEEKAEQKEKKTPSPSDVARRDSLRKELVRQQKALSAKEAKRAGKDLNRPFRIELDYLPGTLSVKLHCRGGVMPPVEMGGYYFEWPEHPIYSKYKDETPNLVFERKDIFGGEIFAGKRVEGKGPQATVSLTFTLYHRPGKVAVASN